LDAPERDDIVALQRLLPIDERLFFLYASRAEVLAEAKRQEGGESNVIMSGFAWAFPLGWQAGEFRRARDMFQAAAPEAEEGARIAGAVGSYAMLSRCHNALGDLRKARETYQHAIALAGKLAGDPLLGAQSVPAQQVLAALDELNLANGTHAEAAELVRQLYAQDQPELRWARATLDAGAARIMADAGQEDEALMALNALARRIDRIAPTDANLTRVLCDAAHALWSLQRTDHLEAIERNLRAKVLDPDFRYPMVDARHAMARLCGVSGRFDEAREWFAKARDVLEEQGARPLRAICDYDEALMFVRRGEDGDGDRARPLLDAALVQFREIGMTGWVRKAEELRTKIDVA
jgi:tetratricopeptide (TPR) repeat protein